MRKLPLILCCLLGSTIVALAQPANDECVNAIVIPDVTTFCSAIGAYNNINATPSNLSDPGCFGSVQKDVWFSFTAQFTDVNIAIRGATAQGGAGGTLNDPQVAVYLGTCPTLSGVGCQTSAGNENITEIYLGGLFVGSNYLIRVQGRTGFSGTFQICINNYNPPQIPTSDCPKASILCDKSPFVVKSVTGAGSDNTEMEDATCFFNGIQGLKESNSTWFVWTCAQSGTLEFTLSPINLPDDLDFVLYKLPNGIGNCQGKEIKRCMASGLSQGQQYPSPCLGPTGLRAGDADISEDAGCQEAGDDAWLSPFNMIAGETYALVINNFSETGNGFNVEFGGTGLFLGPEAKFVTDPMAVCLGTLIKVIDSSSFSIGAITSWKWSFGADAVPQTATGQGPHDVQFNSPGLHPVVMTLETDLGCKVTAIQNALIYPDVEVDTVIAAPDCNGTANGEIRVTNPKMGTPPYEYNWNGAGFQTSNTLSNVGVGVYSLEIRDANNCRTNLDIEVKERVLTVDADVTKPLCFGDANGIITMNILNGKPPIQYDWGSGFIPENMMGGFAAGIYTIQAIDDVLCKGNFTVTVTDNPLLQLAMDTIDISCFGADDGMVEALASGGVNNYQYAWSDGQGTKKANNLVSGQYSVTVTDGNECTIIGAAFVTEPPDVNLSLLDVLDVLCNGLPTGAITVEGGGGRPDYTYSTDGAVYAATNVLTGLAAGDYWVKVKDAFGCVDSVFASVSQPPPVTVTAMPSDTTLKLGFPLDITTFTTPVGRPVTFEWGPGLGLSCADCPNPTLNAVSSQIYVVRVTDEDGCVGLDTIRILVKEDRPVYIPNVFAPDKSGLNNRFTLYGGPAAKSIRLLRVYDRWGSLIYETGNIDLNDPNLGWDGTYKGQDLMGVFTFYATVEFIDEKEITYSGDVTIVR